MCDNLRWFHPPLVVLDGVTAGGLGLLQSGRRTKGSRRSRPHLDCHRPSAQSRRSCWRRPTRRHQRHSWNHRII